MGEVRERDSGSKVMSIETGFSCNAYCGFCPQLNYRGELIAGLSPDLSTDALRERIRYGAQHGYRQIGFSGGEPTIRKDIVELVAYARAQGYELIGMTTNGMMLAYPGFAAALLRAGLNSINFSVNGPNAKVHDAMMRTPGSFEQLVRGLDHVRGLRDRTRLRVEMMSMTLASPQVVEHFPEIVRFTGARGVRLHMIQPFLMTKGNTHLAHHYLTSYDAIERAIRAAVDVAQDHGGHIKLFNTPVCLFWDIEERLERQWKKLDVFREHEKRRPGELTMLARGATRETPVGYYRVDACATCDEPCNGFRAEYYPQEAMVAQITGAIEEHVVAHGGAEMWIGGLELLSGESQRAVLGAARARGVRRLMLLSGGIGRAYDEQFEEGIQQLVDEVCFVVQPRRPDARELKDRHLAHGNLDDIRKGLERLRRRIESDAGSVSATLSVHDLRRDPTLPDQIRRLGVRNLRLGAEEGRDGAGAAAPFAHADARSAIAGARAAGLTVTLLAATAEAPGVNDASDVPHVPGAPHAHHAHHALQVPHLIDWRRRLLAHRWASREAEWIAWSIPSWSRAAAMPAGAGDGATLPARAHALAP